MDDPSNVLAVAVDGCSSEAPKDHVVGAILSGWQMVAAVADSRPFPFQGVSIVPCVLDDGRVLQLTTTITGSDFKQQAKRRKTIIHNEVEARQQDVSVSMKQIADILDRLVRCGGGGGGGCDSDEVEEDAAMDIARLAATVKNHKREIERLKGLESVTVQYSECSATRSLRLAAGRMTHVPREFFASPLPSSSSSAAASASSAVSSGSDSECVQWVWMPVQPSAAEVAEVQSLQEEREVSVDVPLPKQITSVELKYVSDFDENGLFHYLSTARGTAAWRNPVESGVVTVTSSHPVDPDCPVSNIFSRTDDVCDFMHLASYLWHCVDLGADTTIAKVTHYSLRLAAAWQRDLWFSWTLEASVDGREWELLEDHCVKPFGGGLDVACTRQLAGTSAPARFLRIATSSSVRGLEVYGTLFAA